ncbi:MAG: hypothetical protein ABFC56_14670 [Clostridiaceae bacterium]
MKKLFSSEKGKRLLIGLGLVVVALAFGFVLQGLLLDGGVRWKQAVFFLVVTGTGISGILYIFLARKGLMIGYGIFIYISIMIAFSSIEIGLVGILLVLPGIVGPSLLKYYITRKKKTSGTKRLNNETSYQQIQEDQAAWAQMQSEKAALLVAKKSNGAIYQLFCQDGELLFYKVGSFFRDLEIKNLKSEDNLPPLGKDDFKIILKDVTTLRFHDVYSDTNPFDMEISIITWEKRYFLTAILAEGGTKLEQFLREKIPPNAQLERKTVSHYIPSLNRKRRDIMRKVYFGICAFATIAGLAWIFLDVPYQLFAWLTMLPPPLLLMMHYLFPNEVTLAEESKFVHGRVKIMYALLFSIAPLSLRAILDFHILKFGRFLLVSGILIVLFVIQAYLSSEECRIRKIQLLGLTCILGIYCFSAVSITNALLDRVPPQDKMAMVIDKHISSGKGGDSYFLDLQTSPEEEYSFRVEESLYYETQINDTVNVLFYQGAFDIPYAQIEDIP